MSKPNLDSIAEGLAQCDRPGLLRLKKWLLAGKPVLLNGGISGSYDGGETVY